MRQISRLMTKLTKSYSSHAINLLNVIIQSQSCCNQNRTCWIVATINPIPCSIVRYILKEAKQGAFESVLVHFLLQTPME